MASVEVKEFGKGISSEVLCEGSDSIKGESIGKVRSGVSRGKRIW